MSERGRTYEPAEDLRAHFLNPPFGEPAAGGCPDPGTLWMVARKELPRAELQALVDHVGACPACTVAWSLAREQFLEENASARAASLDDAPEGLADSVRSSSWSVWAPVAAAAVVVLAVAGVALTQLWSVEPGADSPPPVYRVGEGSVIRTLVPDGSALPRAEFLLRWSISAPEGAPGGASAGAPEGTKYSITVTDSRLESVVTRNGLTEARFLVPEQALERLATGDRILWRVEADLPGGYRVASKTFVAVIE